MEQRLKERFKSENIFANCGNVSDNSLTSVVKLMHSLPVAVRCTRRRQQISALLKMQNPLLLQALSDRRVERT